MITRPGYNHRIRCHVYAQADRARVNGNPQRGGVARSLGEYVIAEVCCEAAAINRIAARNARTACRAGESERGGGCAGLILTRDEPCYCASEIRISDAIK